MHEELLEINLAQWEWVMEDVKSHAKEARTDQISKLF